MLGMRGVEGARESRRMAEEDAEEDEPDGVEAMS